MMELQLSETVARQGNTDPRVLAAIMRIDRRLFLPPEAAAHASADEALPIGLGQTSSAPSLVALMTSALALPRCSRVLEVGTGSGYQAAVLAELGFEVYSIERLAPLAERAALALARMEEKVHLRVGDGTRGWPEEAPFRGILVTAAAAQIPRPLLEQLAVGGRLVMPVGDATRQVLRVVTRTADGYEGRDLADVTFVPLISTH